MTVLDDILRERERCAKIAEEFLDFEYREVEYAGSVVEEDASMRKLADLIRSGEDYVGISRDWYSTRTPHTKSQGGAKESEQNASVSDSEQTGTPIAPQRIPLLRSNWTRRRWMRA